MSSEIRPAFSVIIPTRNRSHILPRAIRSVLNQSFHDFELLIIDDASTDNTRAVVETFQDQRIVFIAREMNGGAAAARNTGISLAKGKYVSLLDDDDEYLDDFLKATHDVLESTPENVGFSWCGVRWVRDAKDGEVLIKDELWRPKFQSREHAYLAFLRHRRVGTNCGLTFRRTVFESVGIFDELFKGGAEDTDFLVRLVRLFEFAVVPGIFLKIHFHPSSSLRSYGRGQAESYERLISKNTVALEQSSELWSSFHYKTGWLHYHGGDRKRGREYMLQAIRKRPFYVKAWLGLLFFETLGPLAPQLHKKISAIRHGLFFQADQ